MNPEFSDFMESSCLALAREVPEFPTQMGLFEIAGESVPQDYFAGIDDESFERRQGVLQASGSSLGRFPRQDLDDPGQLSAEILEFLLEYGYERALLGTAGREFRHHEYLIRPSVGLQSELPLFLAELHPMRHAGDAEDYLSRLKNITAQMAEANDLLQLRQANGFTPPALVLADSIDEIGNFLSTEADQNFLYQALSEKTENLQGLDDQFRSALLKDASHELAHGTYPAYRDLQATLESHLAHSSDEPGLWRLPDGDAWYEFLLRSATTTTLSAAEIHQLGLDETARLEQDLVRACKDLGIESQSVGGCLRTLDEKWSVSLEDTEQNRRRIIEQVEALIADIKKHLPRLFHRLPKGRLTVKPIPRFAESSRNQSYQPPSSDGSRAGFMELNVGQLLDSTDHEMQILVYHELFPGHHLQMTIAQETENLPSLRRIITFDAYIEGWAKYAETIPSVHGINNDPRFRVARLRRELISTINLALDTGIHAMRWSEQQATQFFRDHSGMSDTFSRYIVHRSASVPAQMCSYKIGMMKVLELQKKMELALDERYDVRDFHESVLGRGAMPLFLLESTVKRDIEKLRQAG